MTHNTFAHTLAKGLQLLFAAALVAGLALSLRPTTDVYAQGPVPVTVTIWRVVEFENMDAGQDEESGRGDYSAMVEFSGDGNLAFFPPKPVVEGEGPQGLVIDGAWAIEPFWDWTFAVPRDWGPSIDITFRILDEDPQRLGDHLDISSADGPLLLLTLDLETGIWTGSGVVVTPSCSRSQGETGAVFFDIAVGSQTTNSDGDGLLDSWEMHGFDDECDGTIDVDLPAFGADPMHKDLFLELDWMPGRQPSRAEIQRVKEAFAAAPWNAGTNASQLSHSGGVPGVDAKENPDGRPGINLWVAAGTLYNPDASEGFFQPAGSCSDGVDNDGDSLRDRADPDCIVGFIDDIPGGNEVPLKTDVSGLTDAFYDIKRGNFDPQRRLIFRYSLSSAYATNNTGTAAGGTPIHLIDTNQSWLPGEWVSRTVTITGGKGIGQSAEIIDNSEVTLLIKEQDRWAIPPDRTSTYRISLPDGMAELGGNDFTVFSYCSLAKSG